MAKPPVPQTVPREYAGKWVVWTKDALTIVASGDSPDEARQAAEHAGVTDIVYQWVPPANERFIGVRP